MHIGFVPAMNPLGGGVHQYSLAVLRALDEWSRKAGCPHRFTAFANDPGHPRLAPLAAHGWSLSVLKPPDDGELPREARPKPDVIREQPAMARWFRSRGPELMLYPVSNPLAFETGLPYVMAVHDLQHRLQPEFPEVSAGGEWERREYLYRNGCAGATLLLADSEEGREDILNFYGPHGARPDRVRVLPYLPAEGTAQEVSAPERARVRAAHRLPERYLFYPAQFWPHKNHVRIVQALGLLRQRHGADIPIAFSGTHEGALREKAFAELGALSRDLGIAGSVRFLGYVPTTDMAGLYAEAAALVMPTFFGPTNIPVLEAWALGCPVLCSDIRGIRSQCGDAAVLVDPRSVEAIAGGIWRLWSDAQLRSELAARGRRRLDSWTPDDFRRRLAGILDEAAVLVRNAG